MASGDARWFTPALSATPLADEYRAVESALVRCTTGHHAFDPTRYPPEVVARARGWWLGSMTSEYESVTAFLELHGRLREIGAAVDLQALTLQMANDELRHAVVCGHVIAAMGGEPRIPIPPARPPA